MKGTSWEEGFTGSGKVMGEGTEEWMWLQSVIYKCEIVKNKNK